MNGGKKIDHQLARISHLLKTACAYGLRRVYGCIDHYRLNTQSKSKNIIDMNLPYVIQRSSSGNHLPTLPLTNSQHGARRPDVTDLSTARRFHLSGLATAPPALRGASRRTTEISCGFKRRKTPFTKVS